MKVGDRVRVKDVKGDYQAFYAYNYARDKVYEVESIVNGGDVYVKDRINYFDINSLEVVEDVQD